MGRILIVGFAVLPKPKINPRWEAQAHLPSFLLALQRFAGDSRPLVHRRCVSPADDASSDHQPFNFRDGCSPIGASSSLLKLVLTREFFFFTLICRSFNFYSCRRRSSRTVISDWQVGNVRGGRELVKSTFVSLLIFTQK